MIYPWLREYKQTLNDAYQQNRLHHALLIIGKQGCGKFEFSKDIASSLLCHNSTSLNFCGDCKSCLLEKAGTHPDKLILGETLKSIGVDEIRGLTEFIQSSASLGFNKVVIIQNTENLTVSAANALLKTLEEPNAHRYILLNTTKSQSLSATIRSRCLSYHLKVNDISLVENWWQQFDIQARPWQEYFRQQPLLVSQWCLNQELSDLDNLYNESRKINLQVDTKLLIDIFQKKPEYISIFLLFSHNRLKLLLIEQQVTHNDFYACQKLLIEFETNFRQILGLNLLLAVKSLIYSLQEILNRKI